MDSSVRLDETIEARVFEESDVGTPVTPVALDSVTLARLLEEVRNSPVETAAYNRTHNRHNRT